MRTRTRLTGVMLISLLAGGPVFAQDPRRVPRERRGDAGDQRPNGEDHRGQDRAVLRGQGRPEQPRAGAPNPSPQQPRADAPNLSPPQNAPRPQQARPGPRTTPQGGQQGAARGGNPAGREYAGGSPYGRGDARGGTYGYSRDDAYRRGDGYGHDNRSGGGYAPGYGGRPGYGGARQGPRSYHPYYSMHGWGRPTIIVPRVIRPAFIAVGPYRPYYYRPSISIGVYYGVGGAYPYGYVPRGYYEPAPGRPYGGLRITGAPRDAQVFADGYYVGIVDDFDGIFQNVNLEAGPHRIEIVDQRFESISFDVMIEPGRTTTFRAQPYSY